MLESRNFLSKKWSFVATFWEGGSQTRPGKLRVIEKWEVPRTVSALRALLGLTNYYSCYIGLRKYSCKINGKAKGA